MVVNLEKWKARLRRVPDVVKKAAREGLHREADDLVAAMKRAAPVSPPMEETPGALRDSIHWEPSTKRDLSVVIIADAKDDKGKPIGAHVEHGHRTANGEHVPANPFFFPTYRARKRPMRRRVQAKTRKAVKAFFNP